MTLKSLVDLLDGPVESAEEETFNLFSQALPTSQNLGFVDPKTPTLELSIAGRDLTIHQSPTVLASNRAGGTTGAVLWKVTPALAAWLSSPSNVFFTSGVLSSRSAVLELGCGTSAVVALLLAPRVARYVLTDQPYVARLVALNLAENAAAPARKGLGKPAARDSISFAPLDWETDVVTPALTGDETLRSFDVVVACDCIYNEALIGPFVQACADACRLRVDDGDPNASGGRQPSLCVVAQQLRDPQIFEMWLNTFMNEFHVWAVPDRCLLGDLQSGQGFVVHIGILKGAIEPNSM